MFFIGLRIFIWLSYKIPVVKYNLSSHFLFSLIYKHRITLKFMSDDSYLSQSFTLWIICLLAKICLFHKDPFLQEQTWQAKSYPIQSAPLQVQTLLKKFQDMKLWTNSTVMGIASDMGKMEWTKEVEMRAIWKIWIWKILLKDRCIYTVWFSILPDFREWFYVYTPQTLKLKHGAIFYKTLLSFSCFQTDCPNQTHL